MGDRHHHQGTDHDVIRGWAEERDAKPATVPGTEHDGRAGVPDREDA